MKKALSLILALIIMAVPATAFAEADEDAPIIWMSSLQIMISDNKSFATAGDTVTIAVPVTDNVKVESVIIGVESPSGKQNVTKYMTQYEDSEWYYMSIAITENTEAGYWNVARIKATDSSGHYMYITSLTMYQFGVKGVIENGDVSFTKGTKYTYSPAGVKPDIKVAHKGVALEKDVDYLVKYQNNTKVGTATATVTGIGCFDGVVSKTFTIVPQTKFTVKLSTTRYTYNGKVKNPAVTVYDGKSVVPKSNYTVTYPAGRKNVGKYYVNVVMKNNYSGKKSVCFVIKPKGTTISKTTPIKNGVKVYWNKQSVQTTGYQVQYSTSKSFASDKKHFVSLTGKKCYRTVKGLKSGKKYYIRIRTYKKTDGKTYYSTWSKATTFTAK